MSMPQPDTTFGDIDLDEKIYRILSIPLNSKNRKKVGEYQKKEELVGLFRGFNI